MFAGVTGDIPTFAIPAAAPVDGLRSFGIAVGDVFAIQPIEEQPSRPIGVEAWHLGTIMLGRFSGPPLAFDRAPALVAASGLDHILVQLYVEGGFEGIAGDRAIQVLPGDICVFDLADTLSTRSTAFSNISMLVPREAMAVSVEDLATLHGAVIPGTLPLAAILSDYIRSLAERAPLLSPREARLAAHATVAMTGTVLGGEVERADHRRVARAGGSPLRRVNAHIEAHIHDPLLDAEQIARDLGLSRASLYRLFEASGGVGRYIRRRRLSGAALDLADPTRTDRVGEIGRRWGFPNDASFTRAFRLTFGISPRAARARSLAIPAPDERDTPDERTFAHWMRTLHASGTPTAAG